jgi:hypothetical protein
MPMDDDDEGGGDEQRDLKNMAACFNEVSRFCEIV